jgi:hypothetical protein
MRLWPLTIVVFLVAAASALSLAFVFANPCAGDISSIDPARAMHHDLERDAVSARLASEQAEAIMACGNDPSCIASASLSHTHWEAETLRTLALRQRAELVSLCEMRADER